MLCCKCQMNNKAFYVMKEKEVCLRAIVTTRKCTGFCTTSFLEALCAHDMTTHIDTNCVIHQDISEHPQKKTKLPRFSRK